ncbi:MAG TPA: hypothetical protein VF807_08840 [Ktedonobacterales bacterium]
MDYLIEILPLIAIFIFIMIAFFAAFFLSRAAAHGHDDEWTEQADAEGEHAAAH